MNDNGVTFISAASGDIPIQRMANLSLQPAEDGPSTEELIGEAFERGGELCDPVGPRNSRGLPSNRARSTSVVISITRGYSARRRS